jgi:hypothetical protein
MSERRPTRAPAYASALLILALGLLAIGYPAGFAALVATFQRSPWLYLSAALRIGVGVSFFVAARGSRATLPLFLLGLVMTAGGLVMPFIGQGLTRPILDAWANGATGIVRGWGIGATVVGAFTLWALGPRPAPKTEDQL